MDLVLLAICIVLAFTAPNFLSLENFLNILRAVSMMGLIAFGMTMVIISKEIDLSVGSAVALSGCIAARLMQMGVPIPLAMVITLVTGALIGAFTGFIRVKFEVPSFITTLALFTAERGVALMITNGFPIAITSEWYAFLGGGYVFGIPFPAIIFIIAFAAIHFLMKYTVFGGEVYAVGGNDEAARLSGINVGRVRILVFSITGGLAALSGLLMSSRIASGSPTLAMGLELDVIAAVIIGGTSFTGGIGTVRGTLIGVLFIGVITNGMTLLNLDVYFQYIVRGGLILAAVLANRLQEVKK
ncbi:MAG: ABC transporter permease [Candidatus Hydrogenedentes bacterium]|nr:ABC transporter permease [Candidatus Hydrogenedentota bacterium]